MAKQTIKVTKKKLSFNKDKNKGLGKPVKCKRKVKPHDCCVHKNHYV